MITEQLNDLLTTVESLDTDELKGATIVLQLKSGDVIFNGEDNVSIE